MSELSQFYDTLKQNLNNDQEVSAPGNSGMVRGPVDVPLWKHKAHKHCDKLKNDCHKHLLVQLYCKILPLDQNYIDGHMGMMKQDVDNMLVNKDMTPTQYMTSCYSSTKAPLLEFVIKSIDGIGKAYLEAADEELKDAQADETLPAEPTEPDVEDDNIQSQLVDVKSDTEYETFVDELKKKTIDKIVNDVTKIINDKQEENDMTFNTQSPMDQEQQLESTTSIGLNFIQQRMMKENVEVNDKVLTEMMGMAIREATLNQFDKVFKQPAGEFREFTNRIRSNKGILINESTVKTFIESVTQ